MATSPWLPLPPPNNDEGLTYPTTGALVWVRMRDWSRRPFRAMWVNDSPSAYAWPVDGFDNTIGTFRVPWYHLDAWHP